MSVGRLREAAAQMRAEEDVAVMSAVADWLEWAADRQDSTRRIAVVGPASAVADAYLAGGLDGSERHSYPFLGRLIRSQRYGR